tara:strand:- start:750 stop:2060 length:1311 start_codon:yes stop_codon:yes gene_type:complete
MNFENNFFKNFFGIGLVIFPLFLLIGPLIAELFLTFFLIFSFFYIIKDKQERFYYNKAFLFFLIFYFSTLISTLINFYDLRSSISGIFYFRIPLFAFSIWFILEKSNFFDKRIVLFYTSFFIIIIFDSLLQFYTGRNLLGFEITSRRISSFFNDELILGGFLLRTLPIFLIYFVMSEMFHDKKMNILLLILIAFTSFIIFLSGERSSFFLLFLFFFTLFFISKDLRKFISYVVISFIIISTLLLNFENPNNIDPTNRMFKKTYNQVVGRDAEYLQLDKKKVIDKFYLFSHDHQSHYKLSFSIFKDHILLGSGVKGFRNLCANKIYTLNNEDGCTSHPHNTYIQILVSNGLIGFFLIVLVFFYVLREIFICRIRLRKNEDFNKLDVSKAIAISAIFVNIWPFVPNGSFFNNWLSMIYFYPVGFYLYFKYKTEKNFFK